MTSCCPRCLASRRVIRRLRVFLWTREDGARALWECCDLCDYGRETEILPDVEVVR